MSWLKYGVALALLFFAVGWRIYTQNESMAKIPPELSFSCTDLSQGCIFQQQNIKVAVSSNVVIKAMQPFQLIIRKQDALDYTPVQVKYEMSAMDMGKNEYRFKKKSENSWVAESMLPFCGSGITEWIALLTFKKADGKNFILRTSFQIQ